MQIAPTRARRPAPRRRRASLLILGAWLLGAPGSSPAHEEPPKTAAERAEKLAQRQLMVTCRIQTQHLWVTRSQSGSEAGAETAFLTNRFNESGDLVEQVVHDSASAERSVSFYDESGTWLEELTSKDGVLAERTVFLYGEDALVRAVLVYDGDGRLAESLRYERRPSSDTILVVKRDGADSLQYTIDYRFEPGSDWTRQIEATQRDAKGAILTRVRNLFQSGRRITKEVYGPNGALTHSFSYDYQPGGNYSEIVRRSPAGTIVSRQAYTYHADGLPDTVTDVDASGAVTRRLRYSYERFP
jgi:hypothetical protein